LAPLREMRMSGTATLRLSRPGQWSLFGESDLGRGEAPVAHLRGKIEHANGITRWRDAFIHFAPQGVVAFEGHCTAAVCQSTARLKDAPLDAALSPLVGTEFVTSGRLSGKLLASWRPRAGSWHIEGGLALRRAALARDGTRLRLPPLHARALHAEGKGSRTRLVTIIEPAPAGMPEPATTTSERRAVHSLRHGIRLTLEQDEAAARFRMTNAGGRDAVASSLGLAAMMLARPEATFGENPRIGFDRLDWEWQAGGSSRLSIERPNIAGEIRWRGMGKPAGLPFSCVRITSEREARNDREPDRRWRLKQCRLGQGRWTRLEADLTPDTLRLAGTGAQLDFDALTQAGVRLPPPWDAIRGRFSGSLELQLRAHHLERIMLRADLQDFGTADWRFSGPARAESGQILAPHMLVHGPHGHASLSIDLDPVAGSGRVTVLDAHLDWSSSVGIPDWLAALSLTGRIEQASVDWLEQNLQLAAPATYRWRHGELILPRLDLDIAGGRLAGRKIRLHPEQGYTEVSGLIRTKGLWLERITGLSDLLQARLAGRLHANVRLAVVVPDDWTHWRGDGDLLVFDGSWTPLKGEAAGHRFAFRRLDARFRLREGRLRLDRLKLLSHGRRYRGHAHI
ncbi:MAG: hypothetical protein R8K47_06135, partial [Mariprofundaceae bacterium]